MHIEEQSVLKREDYEGIIQTQQKYFNMKYVLINLTSYELHEDLIFGNCTYYFQIEKKKS